MTPEWCNTPEKRREIFAMLMLACAFLQNEDQAQYWYALAKEADAQCSEPIHKPVINFQI